MLNAAVNVPSPKTGSLNTSKGNRLLMVTKSHVTLPEHPQSDCTTAPSSNRHAPPNAWPSAGDVHVVCWPGRVVTGGDARPNFITSRLRVAWSWGTGPMISNL